MTIPIYLNTLESIVFAIIVIWKLSFIVPAATRADFLLVNFPMEIQPIAGKWLEGFREPLYSRLKAINGPLYPVIDYH
ncbi:MAG TPA: hypothetical protein DDZ83_17005 [Nitrospinae bacterium]|nr:hypothetical protein [Nitrospinota bacterium]